MKHYHLSSGFCLLGSVLCLATMLCFVGTSFAATVTVNAGESLQAAITGANPTDTIEVTGDPTPEDVVVDKALTITGTVTPLPAVQHLNISVPGVVVNSLRVTNPSGNGVYLINDGATATFNGCDISGSNGCGVLVWAPNVALTLDGCAVSNNGSPVNAPTISGTFTAPDITIFVPGWFTRSPGVTAGLFVAGSGADEFEFGGYEDFYQDNMQITLLNTTFSGHTNGFAIADVAYDQATAAGPVVTIDNCEFHGRQSFGGSGFEANNERFAQVAIWKTTGLDFTMTNSTVTLYQDGGIYGEYGALRVQNIGGSAVIEDCVFTGGIRAGIEIHGDPTMDVNFGYFSSATGAMRRCTFTGNMGNKGAIFTRVAPATWVIEDCVFAPDPSATKVHEAFGPRANKGDMDTYAAAQATHPEAGIMDYTFRRCTFTGSENILNQSHIAGSRYVYDDCTFNLANSQAFNIYNTLSGDSAYQDISSVDLVVTNCDLSVAADQSFFFANNYALVGGVTCTLVYNNIELAGDNAFLVRTQQNTGGMYHRFDVIATDNVIDCGGFTNASGLILLDNDDTIGVTASSVELARSTVYGGANTFPVSIPDSGVGYVAIDSQLNIFWDWANQVYHNASLGNVDSVENHNVYVNANASVPVTNDFALGTGSARTDDPDSVFCSLNPSNTLDYLHIKDTGPAYLIDGTHNAGAFGTCYIPPADVDQWNLYR